MKSMRKTRGTLEKLAAYKGFTAEWLAHEFGFSDNGGAGVVIPYQHLDGTPARSQVRKFVETSHPSFWTDEGSGITVYTSQKALNEAENLGWLNDSVKGHPMCGRWRGTTFPRSASPARRCGRPSREAVHLGSVPKVYVAREPGKAGASFVEGIARRALALCSTIEVYALDLQAICGVKDPGDLHVRDPRAFAPELMRAIEKAERVQLSATKAQTNRRAGGVSTSWTFPPSNRSK